MFSGMNEVLPPVEPFGGITADILSLLLGLKHYLKVFIDSCPRGFWSREELPAFSMVWSLG